MNQYQNGNLADLGLDGGPIVNPPGADWELDVETTQWGANASHYTVDDFAEVIDEIMARLIQRVAR